MSTIVNHQESTRERDAGHKTVLSPRERYLEDLRQERERLMRLMEEQRAQEQRSWLYRHILSKIALP